ncbi:MAG: hypothetical protein CMQ05_05170 [Gammaproteobacteria bacterium]|mgnify:CR=1 FL=1|uniref:J domain-containing protein n=1 Tax=OM182 bacterium MED-G24 TaxID=1986255 RepID=A0A2A5WKQ3_9GAMM|nr:hypothetical protein [Gammaproteobacteria bacterium]PDH37100.1 MAG: hypothetical protein CNE99_08630 [OM182 bacterium MED-G24]RPG25808.1 MAG: hypothetical protein CBC10_006240 [Gammaproteobacteria bacterium TMED50]|tara:strand:+ start:5614 stop:6339 length:726 start_codon:yes stop_codon:yes gene_type:complete
MSWIGKLLGGGLGLVVGGPLGAVLGVVIGHHAIDNNESITFDAVETRQSVYFTAVFSLLGKVAKADGLVTKEEIALVEQVMASNPAFTPEVRTLAIEIFNAARDDETDYLDYAVQLRDTFGNAPPVLASILQILTSVAHADGHLHDIEREMLGNIASVFGMQYRDAAGATRDNELAKSYALLNSEPGDTLAVIKRRYRKLAMEYHPDRVQSQGLSPEFAKDAEDRFKDIQYAWDVLEKELA